MFLRRHRITSAIVLILISTLIYLLGWSNIFTAKSVNYSGAPTKSSQTAIKKLAEISNGQRLARIESRKVSARIKTLPWIKTVEISRNWISGQVLVSVQARTPIATFNGQLIDSEGKRFELPGGFKKDLPSVFARDTKSGLAAIELFMNLPAEFSTRTSAFTASSPENIFFNIREDNRKLLVIWGNGKNIALKIKVYKALLALPENSKIKKIDLTDPRSPIVK